MKRSLLAVSAAAALLSMGSPARAQDVSPAAWRRGTLLAGFAGAATASSATRGAAGTSIGWELTPRFAVEGAALWLGAPPGASSFAALLGTQVRLLPSRGRVTPFASGGVGVVRATFDAGATNLPDFYRRRVQQTSASGPAALVFDDLAISAGGGVDWFLRSHLALRPDVRVLFVHDSGVTETVPVYGVHVTYHFESHPITPAIR